MQVFASLLFYLLVATPQVWCARITKKNLVSASDKDAGVVVESAKKMEKGRGLCPRWKPTLGRAGGSVPSLVIVTIASAHDLPWSYFEVDTADPYVEFWMGAEGTRQTWVGNNLLAGHHPEKYWRAETRSLTDNTNPTWEWSCLLAYDASGNTTFTAKMWDHNSLSPDELIGQGSADLFAILKNEDRRGHGEVDVKLGLKDSEWKPLYHGDKRSVLNVRFEVVREKPKYVVNKVEGNVGTRVDHIY